MNLADRYHFDAFGYVLLKGILTPPEIAALTSALLRLKDDPAKETKRIHVNSDRPHMLHVGNLVEYDPAFLVYATHPGLIPSVREVIGGEARLEETEAIINRRDPNFIFPHDLQSAPTGFHTGAEHGWGTYEEGGRFHSLFVKTLAFLTDVGKDDGGTALIPGSHKMGWKQNEMIQAANEDPSLITQIEAKAGDVLLFAESLIHSTTAIRSENERMIIVSGYTPTILREWPGNEISPKFAATLSEPERRLIAGSHSWPWKRP